jgi:hypothetical protein
MSDFRSASNSEDQSEVSRFSVKGVTRLARVVGRLLLWGCVLLLLVRGAISLLATSPSVTATRGVTATRPAHTETSQAQGEVNGNVR